MPGLCASVPASIDTFRQPPVISTRMKETALLVPVVVGATCLKMFAQGELPNIGPGLGTLLGNVGIMGVLIWHLWYHTTVAQPKILGSFREEMEKVRQENATERAAERAAYATERAAERAAFATEQQQTREYAEREKAELRAMLLQNMTATRVAVHDVRDTAQVMMNKVAEVALKKETGS